MLGNRPAMNMLSCPWWTMERGPGSHCAYCESVLRRLERCGVGGGTLLGAANGLGLEAKDDCQFDRVFGVEFGAELEPKYGCHDSGGATGESCPDCGGVASPKSYPLGIPL